MRSSKELYFVEKSSAQARLHGGSCYSISASEKLRLVNLFRPTWVLLWKSGFTPPWLKLLFEQGYESLVGKPRKVTGAA